MDIIYYGELDPFSGIDQQDASLPIVVEELTLLLLSYDVVIVPPENFFDHRLALPAFEALAPFVRAGKLTTTGDRALRRPRDLIDRRIELYTEDRQRPRDSHGAPALPSRRRTVAWHRQRCLADLASRWCDLLPDLWTLQRDVGAQVDAFARQILDGCRTDPTDPASRLLHATVSQALQSGGAPSRGALLARVAAQRDRTLPRHVAEAVISVQIAYFDLGAKAHRFPPSHAEAGSTCRLFPGRFARFLGEHGLAPPDQLASIYDPRASTPRIRAAWRRTGLDPARPLPLAPEALFQLAASPDWISLRAFLRGDPDAESCRAVAARLARSGDLRDLLPHLDGILRDTARPVPAPSPLVLPSEWQLAIQATLAPVLPAPARSSAFTLDLDTFTMRADATGKAVSLQKTEARLLTLLAIAGEDGLTVTDVKQHLLDLGRLAACSSTAQPLEWTPQTRENDARDGIYLDRANVFKTRTNQTLEPLDVHIDVTQGKGIWRLVHTAGDPCPVRLEGTLWSFLAPSSPLEAPPELPSNLAPLWAALSAAAPHPVGVPALAEHLGTRCDESGHRQATRALGELDRHLAAARLPVRVQCVHKGYYALSVGKPRLAQPAPSRPIPPSPPSLTTLRPSPAM